jgi:hypothetical protein
MKSDVEGTATSKILRNTAVREYNKIHQMEENMYENNKLKLILWQMTVGLSKKLNKKEVTVHFH